ncbi:hypothetical protein [Vibrio breoganii]|uniref:hypothetical protein n=1 Tax=Vibrio breoganii TaxID=553239 RepID=UPI000C84B5DC|nr:hypothetical protein [Vibrio breoganii]PMK30635.1 hypothetical protein BCU03_09465 [Vibrio breoganii]
MAHRIRVPKLATLLKNGTPAGFTIDRRGEMDKFIFDLMMAQKDYGLKETEIGEFTKRYTSPKHDFVVKQHYNRDFCLTKITVASTKIGI